MSSFSFLVFAVFDFSQKKPQSFLSSRPILADFWIFWGNNSSKQKKKHFLTIFWTLNLYSGATTKGWKNSIGFSDSELSAQYFEKKNLLTKSNILGARQVLTFLV